MCVCLSLSAGCVTEQGVADGPPAAQALCEGPLAAGWDVSARLSGTGMVSIRLTPNSAP